MKFFRKTVDKVYLIVVEIQKNMIRKKVVSSFWLKEIPKIGSKFQIFLGNHQKSTFASRFMRKNVEKIELRSQKKFLSSNNS